MLSIFMADNEISCKKNWVTDTYPKWIYLDSHIVVQWVMDYNIDFPDSLVTERKVGTGQSSDL